MNTSRSQSRRERVRLVRLSKKEKKVAEAVTLPLTLLLLIIFYLFRLLVVVLYRLKFWIGRFCLVLFILSSAYSALQGVVYAPKSAHAMDGIKHTFNIPTLNPNLTEREQNIALINKIWGKDSDTGLAIARCESGYRTKATNYNTNYTVDQGVFQINSVHNMPEMDQAVANISTGYLMYQQQNVQPWESSRKCWDN